MKLIIFANTNQDKETQTARIMSYTMQDMESYYQQLMSYFQREEYKTTSNKDRAHNTTMLRFMLDNSNTVKMFCGEMSVFRNKFYDTIDRDNKACADDDSEGLGQTLKKKLIASLEKFIDDSNSHLDIILESFSSKYLDDLIDCNLFKDGIKNKKITLRYLDLDRIQTRYLSHFSFTDKKILRMETNKSTHEGICGFNIDQEIFDDMNKNFKIFTEASISI